jgi:hypothetical protein
LVCCSRPQHQCPSWFTKISSLSHTENFEKAKDEPKGSPILDSLDFGVWWRQKRLPPVFGNNRREVVAKLETAGLEREHLPLKIGGTLDYDQFVMGWLQSKGIVDDNVDIGERRRRMNVLNSRRKLERARLEEVFYNDQATEMRSKEWKLGEDSRRLEGLVHFAKLELAL